jgi:hypothetical protein
MHAVSVDEIQSSSPNPYIRFVYTIPSPETKKRYPERFKPFLDYLKIPEVDIKKRLDGYIDYCCWGN